MDYKRREELLTLGCTRISDKDDLDHLEKILDEDADGTFRCARIFLLAVIDAQSNCDNPISKEEAEEGYRIISFTADEAISIRQNAALDSPYRLRGAS